MRKFLILSAAVAALSLAAAGAQATELVTNGDFATGDLSGWTVYTTGNGVAGVAPAPQVVSFDVTGSGASNAAELQVGDNTFTGQYEGGGISQVISTVAGLLTFSADVAAYASQAANASGGHFSVLLDGVTQSTFNVDSIGFQSPVRGSLTFSTTVAAGNHVLALQALRSFITANQYGHTPFQYFDNVSATQAGGPAPEPAAWALMIAGFGLAGGALRRRAALQA